MIISLKKKKNQISQQHLNRGKVILFFSDKHHCGEVAVNIRHFLKKKINKKTVSDISFPSSQKDVF